MDVKKLTFGLALIWLWRLLRFSAFAFWWFCKAAAKLVVACFAIFILMVPANDDF